MCTHLFGNREATPACNKGGEGVIYWRAVSLMASACDALCLCLAVAAVLLQGLSSFIPHCCLFNSSFVAHCCLFQRNSSASRLSAC